MKTNTLFKIAAISALFSPALFAATTLKFDLDRSLAFNGQTPSGKAPWASVTISDIDTKQVKFEVQSNLTGSQFITDFAFNFDPSLDIKKLTLSDFKSTGSFTLPTVSLASNLLSSGQGTRFDGHLFFADSEKNGASKLFGNNDKLSFVATYSGSGFSAAAFNFMDYSGQSYAAAYVKGKGDCGEDNWISTSTPGKCIPETSSLLLVALTGILFLNRKRP